MLHTDQKNEYTFVTIMCSITLLQIPTQFPPLQNFNLCV